MARILRIIVNIIFYIIEVLLLLRFLLKLFNANLASGFAVWILQATSSLMAPFYNIFPNLNLGGLIIDVSILVALLVYIIIGQLILWVVSLLVFPPTRRID